MTRQFRGILLKQLGIQSLYRAVIMAFVCMLVINKSQAAAVDCQQTQGQVSRALFTTQIEDREPVNQVLILENKYTKVYFFTDLRHFEGQDVVHRWEHDGHVIAEKVFSVKGPRWRVYSTQLLDPAMLGKWTVVVTDKNGCPLKAAVFEYVATDPNGAGSAMINLK